MTATEPEILQNDDWRFDAVGDWERRIGSHYVQCYTWLADADDRLREWPGVLRQFADWLSEAFPETRYDEAAVQLADEMSRLSFLGDGVTRRRGHHAGSGLDRVAWFFLARLIARRHPNDLLPVFNMPPAIMFGCGSPIMQQVVGTVAFGVEKEVTALRSSEIRKQVERLSASGKRPP